MVNINLPLADRIENYSIKEDEKLDSLWQELTQEQSRGKGKEFKWPIPRLLWEKTEAKEQLEEGYLAYSNFDRVSLPLDWSENPFKDKTWANRLMCLQPMDAYVIAFERGEGTFWLRKAADIYFSWVDFHLVQKRRAYLSWYDMPIGYRAIKTALLLHYFLEGHLELAEEEKRLLLLSAQAHINELLIPENLSMGNHGIFQIHGLRVISTMFWNLPSSENADSYSREQMGILIKRQFNEKGVHLEHTPYYHLFMMGELSSIDSSGWWEDLGVSSTLALAEGVKNWLIQPDHTPVRIGDTQLFGKWPGVNYSETVKSDVLTSAYFKEAGYAIARDSTSQLFFHGAYHSKAHKHADDLTFELYDFDRRIVVDSGSAGYKSGEDRSYLLSTAAHNTVSIHGLSHPRDGRDSYGSAIRDFHVDGKAAYLRAEVDHSTQNWRHNRALVWNAHESLILTDTINSAVEDKFAWWIHFAPEFRLASENLITDGEVEIEVVTNEAIEWHIGSKEPYAGWRANGLGPLVPALSGVMHATGKQVAFSAILRYRLR